MYRTDADACIAAHRAMSCVVCQTAAVDVVIRIDRHGAYAAIDPHGAQITRSTCYGQLGVEVAAAGRRGGARWRDQTTCASLRSPVG